MAEYFKRPWENRESYAAHSPLTFAERVTTPLLIQHGERDPRVPIAERVEVLSRAEGDRKTVEFDIYPRGGHVLYEPMQQREQMRRNLEWFTRWIPLDSPHHRLEQPLERGGRIGGPAGMHRRHLDDRAARRHQPVEAAALRQLADRPGLGAAAAHARNRREVGAHRLEIERRDPARAAALRPARSAPRGNRRPAHDRITPTLIRSPRSTRGTTRMMA